MNTMKAMVLTGLRKLEICEKPVPQLIKPGDVLVRVKSVGVCGSDIHYYREGKIGSQVVEYPFTIGHEGAGVVEKISPGVEHLKPGDRVAIEPSMPCFKCDQCQQQRYHTCRKLLFLGCPGQADGCFSEFVVMPEHSCLKIDGRMSFDQAALSEPLAIGMYAVSLAHSVKAKKIGILGAGPIGISVLLSARALGCDTTYITDKLEPRLSLASEMGADWTGNPNKSDIVKDILSIEKLGLDYVFECCGQQEAADQAIKILKPGGTLLIIGIPEFSRWSFDVDDLRRREITIQNVRRQNQMAEKTLRMIEDGTLVPDKMQTHTFNIDNIAEAFDLVDNYRDGVMKAMIHFDN
jgi:L-iditol 2-dehydrogenase